MKVVRLGDTSSHGGAVISAASRTYLAGVRVARKGDLHACPIPGHGVTPIVTGAEGCLVEGQPVAREGDVAGCGAVLVASHHSWTVGR